MATSRVSGINRTPEDSFATIRFRSAGSPCLNSLTRFRAARICSGWCTVPRGQRLSENPSLFEPLARFAVEMYLSDGSQGMHGLHSNRTTNQQDLPVH